MNVNVGSLLVATGVVLAVLSLLVTAPLLVPAVVLIGVGVLV